MKPSIKLFMGRYYIPRGSLMLIFTTTSLNRKLEMHTSSGTCAMADVRSCHACIMPGGNAPASGAMQECFSLQVLPCLAPQATATRSKDQRDNRLGIQCKQIPTTLPPAACKPYIYYTAPNT